MEKLLEQILEEKYKKSIKEASNEEIYTALLILTKEKMQGAKRNEGKKKLYYISAEFLIGKLLSNNLINLGLFDETKEVLEKHGHNITEIEEIEICTDNDFAGRWACASLKKAYGTAYRIIENLPQIGGADYADLAKMKKEEKKKVRTAPER